MSRIIIGTRGSKLARWQTGWVRAQLEEKWPGLTVEERVITTKGDRVLSESLPKLGEQGKGLFTKELEVAMLDRSIDAAVHSLKDLPTDLPTDLSLGAICEREDPRDALLSRTGLVLRDLPRGASVGTSSLRRRAQLRQLRPDLRVEPARGNIDTRLGQLERGRFDALVLAAAGLRRLGYEDRITECFPVEVMLPAVGQGALAVEVRSGDNRILEIVRALDHAPTRLCCEAERACLRALGGGCLVPIAAHAVIHGNRLKVSGLVAGPDGSQIIRADAEEIAEDALGVGARLARELKAQGAGELLARDGANP